MDEMMCDFMAKTLRMVQNGPTIDHRAVGSTHTSPLLSQQDQRSYEDANFRHQRVARDFSQETTFRDTPLRSITAEEEGKVSTPKDTNTNDILYSNNDREGHVAFAEHPDKFTTDSNWRGDSRGQQYL
jgi:hypothetical protein